jgi:hypothetical protein
VSFGYNAPFRSVTVAKGCVTTRLRILFDGVITQESRKGPNQDCHFSYGIFVGQQQCGDATAPHAMGYADAKRAMTLACETSTDLRRGDHDISFRLVSEESGCTVSIRDPAYVVVQEFGPRP